MNIPTTGIRVCPGMHIHAPMKVWHHLPVATGTRGCWPAQGRVAHMGPRRDGKLISTAELFAICSQFLKVQSCYAACDCYPAPELLFNIGNMKSYCPPGHHAHIHSCDRLAGVDPNMFSPLCSNGPSLVSHKRRDKRTQQSWTLSPGTGTQRQNPSHSFAADLLLPAGHVGSTSAGLSALICISGFPSSHAIGRQDVELRRRRKAGVISNTLSFPLLINR